MTAPINKTMDRDDLLTESARPVVGELNRLIRQIYVVGEVMSSWYGMLEAPFTPVGMENRGAGYEPLPGAHDDKRIPWYLYWEIEWVIRNGPRLKKGMRILDAGGTSSLFSCYMASLGVEVHSIDINPTLLENASKLAQIFNWKMNVYCMDVEKMAFEDMFFDHAFSICVFEHLDFYTKQKAMVEIHRCLKPKGQLCLTFDYKNPAPYVFGYFGFDQRYRNALDSPERVKQVLGSSGLYSMKGNQDFFDSGKRYLRPPHESGANDGREYTFGALFLEKKDFF